MVITKRKEDDMLQKVIRVGNSSAVTIPKEFLQQLEWTVGDRVEMQITKKALKIQAVSRKKILRKSSGINRSFAHSVDEFIEKYRPALEELAKR